MEKRTFTNVAIEDKHVGTLQVAFTSSGDMVYGKIWLNNHILKWVCHDQNYDSKHGMYPFVESVLEEVI